MSMFTHNRPGLNLNGTWKFNPDPYQRCRQQEWWKNPGKDDNFFPCWDPEGLWDIEVPSTWKTQREELKWYDGDVNYMKEFDLDDIPEGSEVFLYFDSVVYLADVYLNGENLGQHAHGYSPFAMRATEHVKKGSNQLFVLVENKLSPDRVPGIRFDWNNDGGIIGNVRVVIVPKTHLKNFRTSTTLKSDQVEIKVDIWLENLTQTVTEDITLKISELGIEQTLSATSGEESTFSLTLDRAQIELWDTENPKLYRVELSTSHETISDEIGFRELRTEGFDVLLNGKPIRLYGVCTHSEFEGTGRATNPAGIQKMINAVKELGCNFIRCAHYPYGEDWGRALDKAGLLWWEEVPVYWLSNIHKDPQLSLALGMLEEMIIRDWNRASLAIWSISNECAGEGDGEATEPNYPYWFKAHDLIRKLDPSRLISSAECGHRKTSLPERRPEDGDHFDDDFSNEIWTKGHPDEFYGLFDILSGNVYVNNPGDGLVAYHKYRDMLKEFNKPLMISEFGSMSLRGATGDATRLGDEDRHALILREAYQSFKELPEITGYMPWCLLDMRVPMHWRWYNAGEGVFRYGLMDQNYQPKQTYSVVREENKALKEAFKI